MLLSCCLIDPCPQPCWACPSVSQHLKIKLACGDKNNRYFDHRFCCCRKCPVSASTPLVRSCDSFFIHICFCHKSTATIDADASEKFVSKSHSLVVFSVIIFECCCFQHKFSFDPPCDMILLKTDGFLMEKVHTYDADASEKYVFPNLDSAVHICFCHKNTSTIDSDASEKFFSKSHSLVVFSVIIFEMLLFQTQIRFRPPL